MAGVGIVLAWFGYSVFYYGLNTVTGGNDSFLSLIWPGRYQPTPRDGAGSSGTPPLTAAQKAVAAQESGGQPAPPTVPPSPTPHR